MSIFWYDTETALIAPGRLAPALTCMTECTEPGQRAALLNHNEAVRRMSEVLQGGWLIVGHNVAYDNAVMAAENPGLLPLIFEAYETDRVTDTKIRQQLGDIADGKFGGYLDKNNVWRKRQYDLASLSRRHLGIELEKDEWRLKYGEFRDVPIEQWPEGAREYPRKDAETTRDVFLIQKKLYGPIILADQFRQTRAYWALHLSSAWGVHTSKENVDRLKGMTEKARDEIFNELVEAGLVRPDGTRDTKAAKARMLQAMGDAHHKTATGGVCLDEEACAASGDQLLIDYSTYSTLNKVLSTDIPMLAAATHTPIHTSYGMAETGRTTSSKNRALGASGGGNIQNLRVLPGIRECIVPRPGKVFIQADYSAFELYALSQSCLDFLGHSKLAEALNSGLDPHCVVASQISGAPYDEVKKACKRKSDKFYHERQCGKVADFGLPGGLGVKKFVDYAWTGYHVKLDEERAAFIKQAWFQAWPEMIEFFEYVNSLKGDNGYSVYLPRSKRWRGGATFCAAANTLFQGVAADGAKAAAFLIAKACYIEPQSPLFGSRIVAFVHDEFIGETDEEKAPEAAEELSRLMVAGAKTIMPDMSIKAEPCLMRMWSKEAETWRDDKGRLIPWAPKVAA